MTTIICARCGTENSSSVIYCKQCKINLKWALEHSEASLKPEPDEAKANIPDDEITAPDKVSATVTSMLLCILAGVIASAIPYSFFWYGTFYLPDFLCPTVPIGILSGVVIYSIMRKKQFESTLTKIIAGIGIGFGIGIFGQLGYLILLVMMGFSG